LLVNKVFVFYFSFSIKYKHNYTISNSFAIIFFNIMF